MALNFNIPGMKFHVPWFMFDIDNFQLITSPLVPSDIKDSKSIVYTETPIPGLNYQPFSYGGGGNRKLSFTLPLIKRNNTIGNVLLLKQFDNLRNQATGFFSLSGQFKPNPQVLYYWGTGSVPLIYNVTKCDPTHKAGWVNNLGQPTYSEIEIELMLDESNVLYIAEEIFRKVSSIAGMAIGLAQNTGLVKDKRPI
jgi:hypothetical protein